MYSVTSRYSFQELRDVYKLVLDSCPSEANIPCVLVGNKTDVDGFREVSSEEGKEWAEKKGWSFFEISCKNGQGVEDALAKVVKSVDDTDRQKWNENSPISPRGKRKD